MLEATGNLWTHQPADVRIITTNGAWAGEGARLHAVMGRGVALQAAERWPELPRRFAGLLQQYGNRPMRLMPLEDGGWLVSLPVKRHWRERANMQLIRYSCRTLVEMADKFGWQHVVLPEPGTGNGGLTWYGQVAPIVTRILDDRFTVVHRR